MITLSKKQNQFIVEANQVWNFKIGAVRSGKSYEDVAYEIINGINERRGKAGLNVILGVSKTTIERNVLQPMREIYTSALVGTINSQNIAIICGEPVYCIGAEKQSQVAKIQGSSIKYCYGDEVAKWHKDVFMMLESRLDKSYSRFSGSANPEHPNHWLKQFIDRKDIPIYVQHYTIFDNPFLPKEYVERLCTEYQGFWYDRLILGQWVLSSGRCYEKLGDNRDEYFREETEQDIADYGQIVISCDFGGRLSNHTFVASAISKRRNKIYVLKSEILKADGVDGEELTNTFERFCNEVKAKYMLRAMYCYCDSAEQTHINTFDKRSKAKNMGVIVKNAYKKPINDRISFINRLIALKRIVWFKDAETSFNAMSTCVYNTKEGHEDERLDDGTSDIDSVDATEYGIEIHMNEMIRTMERGALNG